MLSKLLFKKSNKSQEQDNKIQKIANGIKDTSSKIAGLVSEKVDQAQKEFFSIKEKSKDLRSTNYELGMKHLENDKLSEATMRFRLIIKFWPDFYDAYYQLAYCLVLQGKFYEARKRLLDLLEKKPDFDPLARQLLEYIDSSLNEDDATQS